MATYLWLLCILLGWACADLVDIGGPSRSFVSLATLGTSNLHCDDCYYLLPLPFQFQFAALKTSAIVISSNGVINLNGSDTNTGCCEPIPISKSSYPYPRIAVAQTALSTNKTVSIVPIGNVKCREKPRKLITTDRMEDLYI